MKCNIGIGIAMLEIRYGGSLKCRRLVRSSPLEATVQVHEDAKQGPPLSFSPSQPLYLYQRAEPLKNTEATGVQRKSAQAISPEGKHKQQKPGVDFKEAAGRCWAKEGQPRIPEWLVLWRRMGTGIEGTGEGCQR